MTCFFCNGSILSFADDTTFCVSDSNPDILFNNANILINSLFISFCSNQLSLNPNKTKHIVIRHPSLKGDLFQKHILIENTFLHRIGKDCDEKGHKFLGILIDENLTWKHHLSHINQKVSRALFSLKQVKHFLPKQCMKRLYYSLIHSHLSYGNLVWGNKTQFCYKNAVSVFCKQCEVQQPYQYHLMTFLHSIEICQTTV